jgi:anion-transporting  ArsA/GET3 family ATPase
VSGSAEKLAKLLAQRAILVVVGTGGVGKTTVAAALALEAAQRGRRVLALTIDPARRLCDALGLVPPATGEDASPHESKPQHVPLPNSADTDGSLSVVMLDMKSTFDGLVERFSESEESRARILANPIYAHVSDALAGSGEYAAMEKVFELTESGDYDLIIVDTPPSQHALDFLDAPRRLLEFLDSRLVQLLFHPAMAAGRFGFKLFNRTSQKALQMLERISGVGFLEDISEFLMAFEGMSEGFRDRATRVRQLLLGPTSGFLLVSGPSTEGTRRAMEFLERMTGSGVPVEGVLTNRMRVFPGGDTRAATLTASEADLARLAEALVRATPEGAADFDSIAAARTAVRLANGYASLVEMDRQSTEPLREHTMRNGQIFQEIPQLERDVSDVDTLLRLGDLLFERARPEAD